MTPEMPRRALASFPPAPNESDARRIRHVDHRAIGHRRRHLFRMVFGQHSAGRSSPRRISVGQSTRRRERFDVAALHQPALKKGVNASGSMSSKHLPGNAGSSGRAVLRGACLLPCPATGIRISVSSLVISPHGSAVAGQTLHSREHCIKRRLADMRDQRESPAVLPTPAPAPFPAPAPASADGR